MIEIKNRWNGSVIKALDEADLSDADLSDANLSGANLRGADLSGADGLPSAPIVPQIDVKILAALKTGGVLEMGSWHKCDTEDTDDCISGRGER